MEKKLNSNIHPWIRALVVTKRMRGLTWPEVSALSGVHHKTIIRWFSEPDIKAPSIRKFEAVALALGLSLSVSVNKEWKRNG